MRPSKLRLPDSTAVAYKSRSMISCWIFGSSAPLNILSKSLGSSNAINIVHATVDALKQLEQPEGVAARRGLPLEDIAPQSMLRARAEGEAEKRAEAEKKEAEKAAEGVEA